jgi:GH15 family glucan-1,4-alpha-glucosidase
MGWVALDRAAKLAAICGDNKLKAEWAELAKEIKADILAHGVGDRGVLCYGRPGRRQSGWITRPKPRSRYPLLMFSWSIPCYP